MPEKCATKFCRGEIALTYLGKPLCQKCYERICDEEEKMVNGVYKTALDKVLEE